MIDYSLRKFWFSSISLNGLSFIRKSSKLFVSRASERHPRYSFSVATNMWLTARCCWLSCRISEIEFSLLSFGQQLRLDMGSSYRQGCDSVLMGVARVEASLKKSKSRFWSKLEAISLPILSFWISRPEFDESPEIFIEHSSVETVWMESGFFWAITVDGSSLALWTWHLYNRLESLLFCDSFLGSVSWWQFFICSLSELRLA